MKNFVQRALWVLPFLLAAAFSLKSFREPDLWWQIRTGQWILEKGRVPRADPFSFTHYGQDWINIKWGFEVIAAWIANLAGPESVFILQVLVSMLIMGLLLRFLRRLGLKEATNWFVLGLLFLFGTEYRMIGRPEMFSHLFSLLFVYLLWSYREDPKKGFAFLLPLIPLQILWTNLHEAYGMGPVILVLFTLGTLAERRFRPDRTTGLLGLLTLGTVLAMAINPRGLALLWRPFNIFNQVQENKYTTELSAVWDADFWTKESWFFVILLALLAWWLRSAASRQMLREKFGAGYLFVALAFVGLGFTANRNLVFPILLLMPVLFVSASAYRLSGSRFSIPFLVLGLLAYMYVVSDRYYRHFRPRDHYGLQTLSINNPIGAAEHLKARGLERSTGFTDYLTSSYLLWKLQPYFRSYIDLRDLDVFPAGFFGNYLNLLNDPEAFHRLDLKKNFRYVVLYRQSAPRLHAYLYNDSVYACTYVDPVAAVYVKTDDFPRGDIFAQPQAVEAGLFSNTLSTVFNPFYRPFDYDALSVDFEAAEYYYIVGMVSAARQRIERYLSYTPGQPEALELQKAILELQAKIPKP